ncbi:MAG: T9SS type A sorting domain-containing protein, partial [Sphingobacteriales bacterium]
WAPGGSGTLFPAFNGPATSYLFANYASTDGTVISNWLITEQVNTISNGDIISFYTRTTTPGATVWPDRLELRMSTAGASTNVGTLPTDVGDFTTLLVSVNPDLTTTGYPSDWTRYEATISGLAAPVSGRFAFRYWVTDAGPNGNNSDLIGLDQVRFETTQTCTAPGATQTMNVAIAGAAGPYTVVYNDGTANQTITNYNSGDNIQVAPTVSTTYTLVSVTSANGCQATGVSGSYSVNISAPPVIGTQPPATLSLCDGQGGTLPVVIAGNNTYQWQVSTDGGTTFTDVVDNTNYSGATTETLTFANVPAAFNNYVYQVIVTNACGSNVTSTTTTVTVTPPAVITTQPVDATACSGTDATFGVVATGTGITYQWEVSTDGGATWSAITGAIGTSYTVANVNISQNGYLYRVLVATCGTPIASDAATLSVQESIVITTQPISIAACTGNTATFAVIATGTGNNYQWQESTDGGITFTDIPGANGATYITPAVTAGMDNYQYQVIVSNPCGTPVTTIPATLTITTAAAITTEPTDVTVCEGDAAAFTVVATGATSYQWQVSTDGGATFADVSGETSPTLNIPAATAANNGYVYQVLIGSCGTPLVSATATITVNEPAVITTQPASTSACDGGNAAFTVAATGTDVTYQWQVSTDGGTTFTDIAGALTANLDLTAVTATMNNNQYQVVLNNACTTGLISTPATLTISSVATITTQPANITACSGANAAFTVVAGGATGYQWQVSTDGGATFTDIAGATNATLDLTGVADTDNNNQYQVAITSCGPTPITSVPATLTVNPAGTITTQPASTTACDGGTATFSVVATGNNLTYQWEISTDGGTTWTAVPGATSATVTAPVTAAMNNGQVRVIINGDCTTGLTSTAATLTVTTAAAITTQPTAVSGCEGTDATFSVAATNATGYQWQVSTDGGTTFTDIAGETNATLTLAAVSGTANDYQYQVVVSNACGDITSTPATLTVNAAPTVSVTADDTSVEVGVTSTLTATATPATATYQWFVDGVAIPGATSATYAAVSNTPGVYEYTVEVTGDGGCTITSSVIEITVTTSNVAFIAPNANRGTFKVSFSNINSVAVARIITIYDSKGRLVYNKTFPVNMANNVEVMDVTVPLLPSGIYWLMLSESNGKRLKTEQLIIQR